MNRLDQVTQKNVAMFEETTAASRTMTSEANALVEVTNRFNTSRPAATARSMPPATPRADRGTAPSADAKTPEPAQPARSVREARAAPTEGALALAVGPDNDDWEEF